MKKLILIILFLNLISCTKTKLNPVTNKFKFLNINAGKNTNTNKGFVSVIWIDELNNNWQITIKNENGSIRNTSSTDFKETSIQDLGLDSTYTITIQGNGDDNQGGGFGARIASQGDVEIKPL